MFTIGEKKRSFLHNLTVYEATFKESHPKYRELANSWVFKLRTFISKVITEEDTLCNARSNLQKAKAMGYGSEEAELSADLEELDRE